MIQFKRGKTREWIAKMNHMEKLAPGQPGYDTDRRKMKIGDGKKTWIELPYAGGLNAEEILDSEKNAKNRFSAFDKLLAGLGNLIGLDFSNDKVAIMTYGSERPDEDTVGQVYLQHYTTEPEADYVVASGNNTNWVYRKWNSGRAECFGTFTVSTAVSEELPGIVDSTTSTTSNSDNDNTTPTTVTGIALYKNNTPIPVFDYPFEFIGEPQVVHEVATIKTNGLLAWLSCTKENTNSKTAKYEIISCVQKQDQADYKISISVSGYWRALQ